MTKSKINSRILDGIKAIRENLTACSESTMKNEYAEGLLTSIGEFKEALDRAQKSVKASSDALSTASIVVNKVCSVPKYRNMAKTYFSNFFQDITNRAQESLNIIEAIVCEDDVAQSFSDTVDSIKDYVESRRENKIKREDDAADETSVH